jgi:nucleotide-binding universal stress UspA family protein
MGVIVVGVDGSEGGQAALRFAAQEAALRGAKLRVVCVWQVPTAVYGGVRGVAADQALGEDRARDVAAQALQEATRLEPAVDRESRAVLGQPAHVLVQESQGADLLVVGSRGLGGFKSLLLGSVGQQCIHHAVCPVVVIPPAGDGVLAGREEGSSR